MLSFKAFNQVGANFHVLMNRNRSYGVNISPVHSTGMQPGEKVIESRWAKKNELKQVQCPAHKQASELSGRTPPKCSRLHLSCFGENQNND